ncbi:hypothetical protein [Umezawaea sp. Da 62-37]|uniref:hypothetical protein n=1 Tax=Umezawaea sp. Da 62-37 TaxID=3075927 RepID=UPI0037DD7F23
MGGGARREDSPVSPERRQGLSSVDGAAVVGHPLLEDVAVAGDVVLTGRLSARTRPWPAGHVVRGSVPLPGAALLELALWAGRQVESGLVEELMVERPLVLPEDGSVELRVRVGAEDAAGRRGLAVHCRVSGADSPSWTRHATGALSSREPVGGVPLVEWPPGGAEVVDPGRLHDPEADAAFEGARAVWRRGPALPGEVLGRPGVRRARRRAPGNGRTWPRPNSCTPGADPLSRSPRSCSPSPPGAATGPPACCGRPPTR